MKKLQLSIEELEIQTSMDRYLQDHKSTLGAKNLDTLFHLTTLAQKDVERSKKTKQITLRIAEKDLVAIKAKALHLGIPYQTLMGSKLHQLATS